MINLKNDDPEKTFVKALLTINTYGESIHEPASTLAKIFTKNPVDKYALTLEDYSDIITNTILPTYSRLIETELAQMYIRHTIREKKRCRWTGHELASKKETASSDTPLSNSQKLPG